MEESQAGWLQGQSEKLNFSSKGTWAKLVAMLSRVSRTHSGHVTRFWSGTHKQKEQCMYLLCQALISLLGVARGHVVMGMGAAILDYEVEPGIKVATGKAKPRP